jgi:hypothetical protein
MVRGFRVKWDSTTIGNLLDEYLRFRPNPMHDEFGLQEATLFLEHSFGIPLSDTEVTVEMLGSRDSLLHFLERKLGNT